MDRICSEFQGQVLIWFQEGIKSAEADKISLVKELSITGIICLTKSSYRLVVREDMSGILILWDLRVRSSLTSGITSLKLKLNYFHRCQFLFSPEHSFFGHALY